MSEALFPACESLRTYSLPVGNGHTLYVEEMGNPQGIPILNFHGGPGSGCNANHRRRFDPAVYRIVAFDQRGAGRSTPVGEILHNTTTDLVKDINRICEHLGIDKFVAYGYSWGSTLALAYAQAYPKRLIGMILGGILLGMKADLTWLMRKGGIADSFFPVEYRGLLDVLDNPSEKDIFLRGYTIMMGSNRMHAERVARAWTLLDVRLCELGFSYKEAVAVANGPGTYERALIQKHYAANLFFLKPNQLMRGMKKLKNIPVHIIQGQQDMLTPPSVAMQVHLALPQSTLTLVPNCGHGGNEALEAERVKAGQKLADLIKGKISVAV